MQGMMRRLRWVVMAALVLPSLVWPAPKPAEAAPNFYGRDVTIGYYDGISHFRYPEPYNGNVFFRCVGVPHSGIALNWLAKTNAGTFGMDDFLNGIHERLFNTTAGTLRGCTAEMDRARASSIVNMMMGYNGNDPAFDLPGQIGSGPTRWTKGVQVAQANWDYFEAMVRAYDANGMAGGWGVNWNDTDTSIGGSYDYLGWDTQLDAVADEDGRFLQENTHEVHPIFLPGDRINGEVVRFYNPNGTVFTILKICANAVGDLAALAPTVLDAAVQTRPGDQLGSTVTAGGTYNLHGLAINPGDLQSGSPAYLEVKVTSGSATGPAFALGAGSAASVDPLADAQGYGTGQTLLATGQTGQSRYFWRYPVPIPGKTTRMPPDGFSFVVPPATPNGTQLCFTAFASPTLNGGYGGGPTRPNAVHCYTVLNPAYPQIQASNSDVHAGGGVCGQTPEPTAAGYIKTLAAADSWGQYAVSAASSINNFRSNGAGSDTMKLGQNGNYAQVCRPDLMQAAAVYTGASQVISANDFDVTGKSGVYFYNGAALTIHGTVGNKLTVVARSGKVVVSGTVQLDGVAHSARSTPSLGVIANGDIEILAGVTRVDAYLFSNGTIDTCKAGSGSCSNVLTVNGFLMGKKLVFNRLGALNAHGITPAETILMAPQIYLNPPMLFDASADNLGLEGQGEKQPLF
jgi:hypothetical protein